MRDKSVPAEGFAFIDDGLARAADGPASVSGGIASTNDGPASATDGFAPAAGPVPVAAGPGSTGGFAPAAGRPAFTDRPVPADGKPSIAATGPVPVAAGPGSADSPAPADGRPVPAAAGPVSTNGFAPADGGPAFTDGPAPADDKPFIVPAGPGSTGGFAPADGRPVPADGDLVPADGRPVPAGPVPVADRLAPAGPVSTGGFAPADGRPVPAAEPMRERRAGELVYYTFPALEESGLCRHCFTTRLGGVSGGCYSTLNMGPSRGDDPAAVAENYRRVFAALGADLSLAVLSRQTHETNVRAVTGGDAGTGLSRPAFRESVDALVTDTPGLVLVTQYADCVPLFFLDPVRPAVGAAHASWRCTLGEIGCLTVRKMTEEYGTRPADLLVGIGPSICGRCFEVDPPVVEEFLRRGITEVTRCSSRRGEKYRIDLRELNRLLLIKAGVRPGNITVTGLCTKCRPDLFFSHRRAGASRGNLAAIISLK